MKKEIKFRALAPVLKGKDKGKLKWFEGVLVGDGAIYIGTKNMGIQLLKDVKALCQYTGLTDKNGKEIYEGDIVKTNWDVGSLIEIIFWHKDGAFRQIPVKEYRFYTERNNWIALWNYSKPVGVGDALIIGNIYENPELLEGKDEQA